MSEAFEIKRVANLTPGNGEEAVFYEVWERIVVDGAEKLHRNADISFSTREEAEDWVSKQTPARAAGLDVPVER